MLSLTSFFFPNKKSSFVIFPDATTMMIDAGTVPINQTLGRVRLRPGFEDLEIRASWPNSSKSPAEWIADYVHHFWPSYPRPSSSRPEPTKKLDFFLLSHFHSDHMGDPTPESRVRGSHRLTGLTELASILPIGTLVDRDYPLYNIPMNLSEWGSAQFDNYAAFVKDGQDFDRIERFDVGSNEQFALKKDRSSTPLFVVRNIKSNLEVWDSKAGKAIPIPGELFTVNKPSRKKWDENELSTAIVIEYGDFRYYEGGDQEQHVMPEDESIGLDSISPTALAAGFVDVATANHHGRGTNQAFCDLLDPAVVILQGLWSDQPLQSTMEFLTQPRRNLPGRPKRLLFVTDVFQKRLDALGETLAGAFAGMNGHVVVRVHPPGQSQTYEIFLLDGDRKVTARHGPFIPKQHSGKQKAS